MLREILVLKSLLATPSTSTLLVPVRSTFWHSSATKIKTVRNAQVKTTATARSISHQLPRKRTIKQYNKNESLETRSETKGLNRVVKRHRYFRRKSPHPRNIVKVLNKRRQRLKQNTQNLRRNDQSQKISKIGAKSESPYQ